MKEVPLTIRPFGEKAVLVEWPNEVKESILNDILAFVKAFTNEYQSEWELVPAYNSVTMIWLSAVKLDFDYAKAQVLGIHKNNTQPIQNERFLWKLPVCYDTEFGIDLLETAESLGLSEDELIKQHTSQEYIVFGIGFLPGFMYLGGLPETLQLARRKAPRLHVEKGSVGLAGKQTGIYPQDSPGGWNIIGNCPIPVFDASKEKPCFISAGDKIQFQSISKAEHDLRKIESDIGIYNIEKTPLDA
ncbi:5-oxoprolinase subunit PxpB [Flagellimonas meridianipacifica]|uniref:KipI family sensor histidine kinase inhibitor n=1 Tax=Flagellimonas meridianipacifica TaxID=1080225 RepID=A0A2T0MB29_9FLAO|nr:5-oxoprolinase subunit PxpB [Allomuricauda pacifica]PRX54706.1 KipI family sensor histidine kinase inhibitor [Allomuricauda pacifica]